MKTHQSKIRRKKSVFIDPTLRQLKRRRGEILHDAKTLTARLAFLLDVLSELETEIESK